MLKSFAEIFRRQKTFPFEIKQIRNKSDTDRFFLQQDLESRRSDPYLPLTSSSAMLIVLSIYAIANLPVRLTLLVHCTAN